MAYAFSIEVANRIRQHMSDHGFAPSYFGFSPIALCSDQMELQPFDFADLPAEIRCNIYSQFLDNVDLATIQHHPLLLVSRAIRKEVIHALLATRPVVITVDNNESCRPMIPNTTYRSLVDVGACFTDVKMRYTFGPRGCRGDIAHIFRAGGKFEHRISRSARCTAWAEVDKVLKKMHKDGDGKLGVLDVVELAQILSEGL